MPFVIAAGAMPGPILFLGLVGVAIALRSVWLLCRGSAVVDNRHRLLSMLVLQCAFAISVVAFAPVPKYGGEKLFMPFFPFFCALEAVGAKAVWTSSSALKKIHNVVSAAVVVLLAILPGALGQVHFGGGFALSYYGEALGGLRGATAAGYERTYYDVADKELARWLSDHAIASDVVHFSPNHKEYERTYRWLRQEGIVRRDLRLTDRIDDATILVLTHERRWKSYAGLLAEHRRYQKVTEKRIDGVPLVTVYRRR